MLILSNNGGNGGGGHWLVRMEWRPAGLSVSLPLLIFPCTIKSRSFLLAPANPGGPGKRAVKMVVVWWWYVCPTYLKVSDSNYCIQIRVNTRLLSGVTSTFRVPYRWPLKCCQMQVGYKLCNHRKASTSSWHYSCLCLQCLTMPVIAGNDS